MTSAAVDGRRPPLPAEVPADARPPVLATAEVNLEVELVITGDAKATKVPGLGTQVRPLS